MTLPVILYACVHNGGRSLAAKVLTEHLAQGAVRARSAGSAPGDGLNPVVVAVLHERGLSVVGERPTRLMPDDVAEADVVVTMGCGETCPIFPGKRYLDWELEDPKGKDLPTVRGIVDEIERRVRALLGDLGTAAGSGGALVGDVGELAPHQGEEGR